MTATTDPYQDLASAYAAGVRELLAPSERMPAVRGAPRAVSPADMAARAEQLAVISAELTQAAGEHLETGDPAERMAAEDALLAKALTDLELCSHLLQVAMMEEEEEAEQSPTRGTVIELGAVDMEAIEKRLRMITGAEPPPPIVVRGADLPADPATARLRLHQSVADALDRITERTGQVGQSAFAGLLALGTTELTQAVGLVGMEVAQALGQAEKVTRLYNAFRAFALRTYETLVTLLGQQVVQTAAQQVVTWLDELREGSQIRDWLAQVYETEQTREELSQLVTRSQAELQRYIDALQGVNELDERYRRRLELIDKLLRGLRFFSAVPAAALPQGRLLMAAAYILLTTYIVLTGADYVDARRLQLLDRVPGVRQIVETNLATG